MRGRSANWDRDGWAWEEFIEIDRSQSSRFTSERFFAKNQDSPRIRLCLPKWVRLTIMD